MGGSDIVIGVFGTLPLMEFAVKQHIGERNGGSRLRDAGDKAAVGAVSVNTGVYLDAAPTLVQGKESVCQAYQAGRIHMVCIDGAFDADIPNARIFYIAERGAVIGRTGAGKGKGVSLAVEVAGERVGSIAAQLEVHRQVGQQLEVLPAEGFSVLDPKCQRIPMIDGSNQIRTLLRAGTHQIGVDIKEIRDQRVTFPMPSATQASKEISIRHGPRINGPVVGLGLIVPDCLVVAIGQYGRSAGFFAEESVAAIVIAQRRWRKKAVQNIQV